MVKQCLNINKIIDVFDQCQICHFVFRLYHGLSPYGLLDHWLSFCWPEFWEERYRFHTCYEIGFFKVPFTVLFWLMFHNF